MNYKLLNDIDKLNNFGEIELMKEYIFLKKMISYTFPHYLKTTKKQKKCIII